MSVGFIGAGRMAQALGRGFISKGIVKPQKMIASDMSESVLQDMKKLGIITTTCNIEVVERSDLVVLAVKPHTVSDVLQEISDFFTNEKIFVSIAAGVPLEVLEANLPMDTRVLRAMPNTASLVHAGATVIAPGKSVRNGDAPLVQKLFQTVGVCYVGTEDKLDAVTGLSGSGPAYAFATIESLADGGVKMGLPRDMSTKLAAQTLFGAAKMVLESEKHPGQLKDEVCSPGGTTIAAMHELERRGFRGTIMNAVEASALKAKEMGELELQKHEESLETEEELEEREVEKIKKQASPQ
ncbi:pyrroline-5-carboxylate reductase 1, mitochondrial-like [Saccostrea echinata]|uniref:pyrroline-5-carboxylate reductase 1, mitochondrial-like n=1 Tax=Saccostrea echinata TaxID=191078 RepID=UPI002A802E4C|nr:pyrroline-5-carboxylate reductase 1, mitochondrial-like [Saccostrea echinata]